MPKKFSNLLFSQAVLPFRRPGKTSHLATRTSNGRSRTELHAEWHQSVRRGRTESARLAGSQRTRKLVCHNRGAVGGEFNSGHVRRQCPIYLWSRTLADR